MLKVLKICYNKTMSYSYNENYNTVYRDAIAQDFANWAIKSMLFKFIVASAPQQDRRQVEMICDGISGLLDIVKPPQTQEGRALVVGTNIYNLSKFL